MSRKSEERAVELIAKIRADALNHLGIDPHKGWARLPPGQNGTAHAAGEWANVERAAEWLYRQVYPTNMAGITGGSRNLIIDPEWLQDTWRRAAQVSHPDLGGSTEAMAKVNRAKDFVEKHRGA